MFSALCHSGNYGSLGNFNVWDGIGLIFNLFFWVAMLAGLTLLVFLVVRRARVRADVVSKTSGQQTGTGASTAKEILQAQYARGEITKEQFERRKKDFD